MKSIYNLNNTSSYYYTYKKIPIRESTNPQKLVTLLSCNRSEGQRFAFHLDIGHIIPSSLNTMLFQLLFVGILRDTNGCHSYYRHNEDIYYLEIPNSLNNKTAKALYFCNLLPQTILHVSPETLEDKRPIYEENSNGYSEIVLKDYSEMKFVCQWLRAIKSDILKRGSNNYKQEFSPYSDVEITLAECYNLLKDICCKKDSSTPYPSFSIFYSFIIFINMQLTFFSNYEVFNWIDTIEGLSDFRCIFLKLLLETSKDFSLRSVSQCDIVGPIYKSKEEIALIEESLGNLHINSDMELNGKHLLIPPVSGPLTRSLSRQISEEMVARFDKMLSWEDSDHPIVAFKLSGYLGINNSI